MSAGHVEASAAVQAAVNANETQRQADRAARRARLEALDAARAGGGAAGATLPVPGDHPQPGIEIPPEPLRPSERLELTVRAFGTPVPQGSHTAYVRGRRAVVVPVNKDALEAWRAIVKAAAESAMTAAGWLTLTGPVEARAVFLLQRPRSVRRLLPTVAPDLDKLTRALGDALTDAGVIADDALIVEWRLAKRYCAGGQKPGVRVVVRPVEDGLL